MWNNPQRFGPTNEYSGAHPETCLCMECCDMYWAHNRSLMCNCRGCQIRRPSIPIAPAPVAPQPEERKPMATVALCDRCGHMGLSTAFGNITWKWSESERFSDVKNVCPGCLAEFHEFINASGMERPPEPFRVPFQPPPDKPEEDPEDVLDRLAAKLAERINPNQKAITNGD